MEENKHTSEILSLAKLTGRLDVSFLDRKKMLDFAILVGERAYDMSDPSVREFYASYLSSKGLYSPDEMSKVVAAGRANSMLVMLAEIEDVLNGVSLHVRDAELIEALLRTDIDAVAGDVRLPFPVMNICVPRGIDMGMGFQVSGMVLIDYRAANLRQKYSNMLQFEPPANGAVPAAFLCLVRPMTIDGKKGESVLIKKFDETIDLNIGDTPPDLSNADVAVLDRQTRLAMALMLYLQSVETDKALAPIPYVKWMGDGLPAGVAKQQSKKRHYSVIDIIAAKRSSSPDHGGSHASPETHWRRGHMRVLKDEKFKRKPDGSLRSIWIRPTKVGTGDSRGERNLTVGRATVKHS